MLVFHCPLQKVCHPLNRMMREKKISAAHARYGCSGLLNTKVFRSTPCALSAALKRIAAMLIPTQVKRFAMVVRLRNQLKTVSDELPRLRYVRREKIQVERTATYGTPLFEHLSNIFGAWPTWARPNKYREPANKKALPEEAAEVKMTALMILGRTLIFAIWIPITQGEEAAVPVPESRLVFV